MLRNAIAKAVDSQMYPPLEASGDQEPTTLGQLYICLFAHFMFSCCRGKSYIGI